jgi:hypothetical protein
LKITPRPRDQTKPLRLISTAVPFAIEIEPMWHQIAG